MPEQLTEDDALAEFRDSLKNADPRFNDQRRRYSELKTQVGGKPSRSQVLDLIRPDYQKHDFEIVASRTPAPPESKPGRGLYGMLTTPVTEMIGEQFGEKGLTIAGSVRHIQEKGRENYGIPIVGPVLQGADAAALKLAEIADSAQTGVGAATTLVLGPLAGRVGKWFPSLGPRLAKLMGGAAMLDAGNDAVQEVTDPTKSVSEKVGAVSADVAQAVLAAYGVKRVKTAAKGSTAPPPAAAPAAVVPTPEPPGSRHPLEVQRNPIADGQTPRPLQDPAELLKPPFPKDATTHPGQASPTVRPVSGPPSPSPQRAGPPEMRDVPFGQAKPVGPKPTGPKQKQLAAGEVDYGPVTVDTPGAINAVEANRIGAKHQVPPGFLVESSRIPNDKLIKEVNRLDEVRAQYTAHPPSPNKVDRVTKDDEVATLTRTINALTDMILSRSHPAKGRGLGQ